MSSARAQQFYKDSFGFEIGWLSPDKEIGAVSLGQCVLFFRVKKAPFEPVAQWVFAADVDAAYATAKAMGAHIADPLETKPWGLRQFTLEDPDCNRFYIFHG
jgi:uncharacterized glyoxalase superfamily protein PhnB